jgi:hypothetical protein
MRVVASEPSKYTTSKTMKTSHLSKERQEPEMLLAPVRWYASLSIVATWLLLPNLINVLVYASKAHTSPSRIHSVTDERIE